MKHLRSLGLLALVSILPIHAQGLLLPGQPSKPDKSFAAAETADAAAPAGALRAIPAGRLTPIDPKQQAAMRAWRISLIPLAASQGLDAASSYGLRELNPLLASPDGSFGAKATTIKFASTAAVIGVEALIIKKWPRSARVLSKFNWAGAALTSSFAVHNFAIR